MKAIDKSKILPHITALVLFLSMSLVYFYPVLEGYQLKQGDTEKGKSMGSEITSHKEKYDENALWSGNMFAGMPSYLTVKVKNSGDFVKYLLVAAKGGLPHPAGAIFAYLLGFYILLLCLRINPWLAIVGAIAFAFSSYFIIIIEAGHNTKIFAIAFMAPVVGGFIEILRGKRVVGAALVAVFTALELYVNHYQITYYLLFVLIFIGISELYYAIKQGALSEFMKRVGIVFIAALLGILPNLGNILITYEYSKQSTRGKTDLTIQPGGESNEKVVSQGLDKDYITQWSYGIDETMTLLVPMAKGGKSIPLLGTEEEVERLRAEDSQFFNLLVTEYQQRNNAVLSYFGNQPIVSGPVYAGIIIVCFALLSLLFVKSRFVWAIFSVTLLAIVLAWGKNFMGVTEFFIDYVPGYNKFRAVAMILLVAEFTLPIMAILFIDKVIKDREIIKEKSKLLYGGLGATFLILLYMAVSPGSFVDLSSDSEIAQAAQAGQSALGVMDQIESYRADVVSQSVWGSLKYLALATILLLLFIYGKIKKELFILGLGALILVDLWTVDKKYLNNEVAQNKVRGESKYVNWVTPLKQKIPFEPSSADLAIMQNETRLNPGIQNAITKRVNDYKEENGRRLDRRKVYELQFAELMEQTHYRVLNTNARLDQDVVTPFFQKSLGGYHGAKMKKYQELVDFYLGMEHYGVRQAFAQGGKEYVNQVLPSLQIANLLNAKYIIGPDRTGQSPQSLVVNPYAYGNAWFVSKVVEVDNADSAMLALDKYNLKDVAIVEKSDAAVISERSYNPSSSDFIQLTNYNPNKLQYEYSASNKSFAVFSEIYYNPGWTVLLDGEKIEFTKVNYLLRGLELPQGKGNIEFVFEPTSVKLGQILTWISSILILALLGFAIFKAVKSEKN